MTEQPSSSEEQRIEQEIVEIPEVQDVLRAVEHLPEAERQTAFSAVRRLAMQITMTQEQYVSPIPPARVMAEYEALQTGCTHRFLTMAEEQGAHRRRLEMTVIQSDKRRELLGLAAGFILAAMIIIGGIHLLSIGRDAAGVSLIAAGAVAVAGVFNYAQNQKKAELKARAEAIEKSVTPTPKRPQLPTPKSNRKKTKRRGRYPHRA